MAKNLALSLRKWHKKNLIGENGGERKINPSANPDIMSMYIYWILIFKMSSNPSSHDDYINYIFFPEYLMSTSYNNLKAGLKSTIDA